MTEQTKSLTPPSDAGSTTPSGGHGVREALDRLERRPVHDGYNDGGDYVWVDYIRYEDVRDLLATTPSPDASPDSGEAASPNHADILDTNAADDWKAQGYASALAHIGNLVSDLARAMKVEQANEDGTWPDLAGCIGKLIDAARQSAGSPASLSGGAEEVEDAQAAAELVDWWDTGILRDGLVRDEAARLVAAGKEDEHSSVRRAEREITSRIVRRAAITAPSPEAPANRQEAEKVERPDFEAAWRAMHDRLAWIQDNRQLRGYWGLHLADIVNELIDAAYPGLREGKGPVIERKRP